MACRYSQAGLKGLHTLKNRDRAVGTILQTLVQAGSLDAYLVKVSKHVNGPASGSERYGWELVDAEETHEATEWQSLDGVPVGMPHLGFAVEDIVQVSGVCAFAWPT